MKSTWLNFTRIIPIIFWLLLAGYSLADNVDQQAIAQLQLPNFHAPQKQFFASGQPTPEQLKSLANLGIKHVINLRPKDEQSFDEQAVASSYGITYHAIPVNGVAGITFENADKLARLLKDLNGQPTLVHCSSGNRVGALIALDASQSKNTGVEAAIAEGKNWGLTRLEGPVRKILETAVQE